MSEAFAAVNDSMADGVNIADAVDAFDAGRLGSRPSNNEIDCGAHIAKRFGQALLLTPLGFEGEDRFAADPFDTAPREPLVVVASDGLEVGCDELKLDRRASAVEDENVHAEQHPEPR
jgi:hypothetical protein